MNYLDCQGDLSNRIRQRAPACPFQNRTQQVFKKGRLVKSGLTGPNSTCLLRTRAHRRNPSGWKQLKKDGSCVSSLTLPGSHPACSDRQHFVGRSDRLWPLLVTLSPPHATQISCHQRSVSSLGSILARRDTDFHVRSGSLVDGNQLNALRRPPALSSLRTNPVRAAASERSQEHTQITAETRWRHEEWRIRCLSRRKRKKKKERCIFYGSMIMEEKQTNFQ